MRRVLVLSHTYLQPAHRGKLRALAARGLEVTVAIPQRWREPWFGRPIDVAWERQGGLEVFPLPARGPPKYSGSALKALLRARRPDLVQIEEDPASPAARQVCGAARRLGIPVVLYTQQNVEQEQGWLGRWEQRRVLRQLQRAIAGGDPTGTAGRPESSRAPPGPARSSAKTPPSPPSPSPRSPAPSRPTSRSTCRTKASRS